MLLTVKAIKMEFINELQKQPESKDTSANRKLKAIDCGDYKLSIQASEYMYCEPRESILLDFYSSMEVAIFNKDFEWVIIKEAGDLPGFDRVNELIERADQFDGSTQVFGWTPIDLIEDLYQYLKTK